MRSPVPASGMMREGPVPTGPSRRYCWRGRAWEEMPNWQRLCSVLDAQGPKTTGELGHVYGIGENVRGIMREANRNLRGSGLLVDSRKTKKLDAQGRRIGNATYLLVDTKLSEMLERSEAQIAEWAERARGGSASKPGCQAFQPSSGSQSRPAPAQLEMGL